MSSVTKIFSDRPDAQRNLENLVEHIKRFHKDMKTGLYRHESFLTVGERQEIRETMALFKEMEKTLREEFLSDTITPKPLSRK